MTPPPTTTPIPTALCFDVEDIIAPECDDAVLWMADILMEYGLTGSFMVMGESARLWEGRGRRDVIEALKRHHVSFHSTWHSVHPTTVEICLDKNFAEGMDALQAWDGQGWADTERIMGRPLLGWARTGNSWTPSVVGLMGRMGRAYAYSQVKLPGHNICWYANTLNFYFDGNFGGFDASFYDDSIFAERMELVTRRQLPAYLASERRGAEWVNFFMCHPTRAISTEFWDNFNFGRGKNPPREDWRPAPQHDRSLIPVMQANFRKLCDYLIQEDRLEIMGWGDMVRRFDGQRAFATHSELVKIAHRIDTERQVLFTDFWSAGEILLMLCRAAAAPQDRYPRPTVYGPLALPPVTPPGELNAQDVKQSAAFVLDAAQSGYLPASVPVNGHPIGLGTYFVALAEAITGRERVSGPADCFYPVAAESIAEEVERVIPEWPIHPLDLDLRILLEQTKLQCWTLKPAWPRDALQE